MKVKSPWRLVIVFLYAKSVSGQYTYTESINTGNSQKSATSLEFVTLVSEKGINTLTITINLKKANAVEKTHSYVYNRQKIKRIKTINQRKLKRHILLAFNLHNNTVGNYFEIRTFLRKGIKRTRRLFNSRLGLHARRWDLS